MNIFRYQFVFMLALIASLSAEATTVSPTTDGSNMTSTGTYSTISPVTGTTAPPDIGPDTNVYNFTSANQSISCLRVKMAVNFTYHGEVINVTKSAEVDNYVTSCQSLVVEFGDPNYFRLNFSKNTNEYYLSSVEALIEKEFVTKDSLKWGLTGLKTSYVCDSGFNFTLSKNITIAATHVQFQAFEMQSNSFGTAKNCKSDLSPIIPIVVGAVLAFLVLIVIIAYLIGRRRSRSGYEEI